MIHVLNLLMLKEAQSVTFALSESSNYWILGKDKNVLADGAKCTLFHGGSNLNMHQRIFCL